MDEDSLTLKKIISGEERWITVTPKAEKWVAYISSSDPEEDGSPGDLVTNGSGEALLFDTAGDAIAGASGG